MFFSRVAHRLKQLINTGGAVNYGYPDLGDVIESESHQCFRFNSDGTLAAQIESFFMPSRIWGEAYKLAEDDPLVKAAHVKYKAVPGSSRDPNFVFNVPEFEIHSPELLQTAEGYRNTLSSQRGFHRARLVLQRLTVLESVVRLVKATHAFPPLRENLRRYLAEAQIMLDIKETDGRIVPMEETLLQKEVIDRLLQRLSARFPRQEKDLVKAY